MPQINFEGDVVYVATYYPPATNRSVFMPCQTSIRGATSWKDACRKFRMTFPDATYVKVDGRSIKD